jgi:hypothetical protein
MNNPQPLKPYDTVSHHNTVTHLYAEKMIVSFREQMREAERLADELNGLLTHYESALEYEGMRGQVEMLGRWAERYRHGLLAADKISQNGKVWMTRLSNRLRLEAEEFGRLEGEGGRANGKFADTQTDDFNAAAQQVGAIASQMEHLFGRPATKSAHDRR